MKARHRKSLDALAGLTLAIAVGAGTCDASWAGDSPSRAGGSGQSALLPAEGTIHVQYEEAKDPNLREIYDLVKAEHGLETLREFLTPFRLPEDLYIKALGCNGVANAYFFRDNNVPTIRICYEYLKEINEKLPKEVTPEGITPHDALVGQLLFALLHEFGHAAFDIYNVPIFGRQEDAADQFATYVMLQFGGERAHRLVRGAAYSYKGFIKDLRDKPEVTLPLAAFSSDHGSPEERFYNLACIAYGYDAQNFASLLDKEYLPERRAKACNYEYSNLRYAFRTMIGPHLDVARAREVLGRTWLPRRNAPASEK